MLAKNSNAAQASIKRWTLRFVPLLSGLLLVASAVVAQDQSAGPVEPEATDPGFRDATNDQQLELLRKLLGVEAPPAPVVADPLPTADTQGLVPEVAEEAAADEKGPAAKPEAKVAPKPAAPKPAVKPAPAAKPKPVAKPRPVAKPKPVVKPRPRRLPARLVKPAEAPAPALSAEEQAQIDSLETHAPTLQDLFGLTTTDLPEAGTIIGAADVDRWEHLLGPSIRWAVRRGGQIEVMDPIHIVDEPARRDATERYHAQVRLREDRRGIDGYVAGVPFPNVSFDDPDAAEKLMFNVENRLIVDDVNAENFRCAGAVLDPRHGMQIDRDLRISNFRRLHYTGRLLVEPIPVWETNENIRYREMLGPVYEPFDLKGSGFTYTRYMDPDRLDDSWLYFPQSRRVRRLSTAQRSEGIFGSDVDLDSYGGFAANPAWFEFSLLGKKTILAPFHSRHNPTKWGPKPADFLFEDTWEPRETWIIGARSKLPGYNFSLRVIYIDAESFLIPYTEVYDNDGQLWRSYIQQWNGNGLEPRPGSDDPKWDFRSSTVQSVMVFDMQLGHTTRCRFPAPEYPEQTGVLLWQGDQGDVHEEDFDVSGFIGQGR